jgi:hypothetical protein
LAVIIVFIAAIVRRNYNLKPPVPELKSGACCDFYVDVGWAEPAMPNKSILQSQKLLGFAALSPTYVMPTDSLFMLFAG